MSTTTDKTQPALIGGLITGVLSALPLVSAGNLCCCLWVLSGGLVAAYILQQNRSEPITASDGAIVGLMSGVIGAFVYLILSIPINLLVEPLERLLSQRLVDSGNLPPQFRDYFATYVGGTVRLVAFFIVLLFAGSIVSTIGGLIGAAIFRKTPPPGIIDIPPAG